MERYFDIYLNAGNSVPVVINANQYDASETWIFTLYTDDNQQYTPQNGSIVGLKSDGKTIANAGTVNGDGQVVIAETEQMTACAGINIFELILNGNHGTANFVVLVEPRPGDNATPSDSDLSLMQEAIEAASTVGTVGTLADKVTNLESQMEVWLTEHAGMSNETILWEGRLTGTGSVELSEDASQFDTIAVYTQATSYFEAGTASEAHYYKASDLIANHAVVSVAVASTVSSTAIQSAIITGVVGISGTQNKTFNLIDRKGLYWTGTATDDAGIILGSSDSALITKVVGIRNEQTDAEVVAARVGSDGTQYNNLKARLDAENSDLKSAIDDIEEQIEGGTGDGLTSAIKSALMQLAQKVAFKDTNGQTYVDDLYDALYPTVVYTAITLNKSSLSFGNLGSTQTLVATTTPKGGYVTWSSSNTSIATVSQTGVVTSVGYGNATITATCGSLSATCSVAIAQATVTSISATYTQSGDVYTDTALDDLKANLVVTAAYNNGATATVPSSDYTLSGTLEVGTSAITVSYNGKTTTFNVVVTAKVVDGAYAIWDARDYTEGQTWNDRIGGIALTPTGSPAKTGNAVVFDGTAKYFSVGQLAVPTAPGVVTIQVAFKITGFTTPSFVLIDDKTSGSYFSLALRPADSAIRTSALQNSVNTTFEYPYTFDTEWHLLTAKLGEQNKLVYIDNTLIENKADARVISVAKAINNSTNLHVGGYSVYDSYMNAQIRSIYIYAKSLSDADIANNYDVESALWG